MLQIKMVDTLFHWTLHELTYEKPFRTNLTVFQIQFKLNEVKVVNEFIYWPNVT